MRLQGARMGLTLDDIEAELGVSRRTAERLRDAVELSFGPLEEVETGERRKRWRLRSDPLRQLIRVAPEELAELESAAEGLERAGLSERAQAIRDVAGKLRALRRPRREVDAEDDLEVLMRTEGLAMRAGPRPHLEAGLLPLLREALTARRVVEFGYRAARTTGATSRQRVEPYGVLYGNRAFLVGPTDWADDPRLWRLDRMRDARILGQTFERDPRLRLAALRGAVVRDVSGGPRRGRAPLRPRRRARRAELPVPSEPDHRPERGRHGHGALPGGRHRGDVLAPGHVGRERHGREAAASSPAPCRDVRFARLPSRAPWVTREPQFSEGWRLTGLGPVTGTGCRRAPTIPRSLHAAALHTAPLPDPPPVNCMTQCCMQALPGCHGNRESRSTRKSPADRACRVIAANSTAARWSRTIQKSSCGVRSTGIRRWIPAPPPVIPAKLVPDPDRGAGIHPGQPIPKLGV